MTESSVLEQVVIREARPEDAAAVLLYMEERLNEPGIDFILSRAEYTLSLQTQRQVLERYAALENYIFLLAWAGDQLVGVAHCQGGGLMATCHTTRLAISVHPVWRDCGVGTALMARVIAWARDARMVKRLELEVFDRNARAIHLYEKCGFVHEGRRERAVYRHGQYHDLLMMALWVEE